MSFVVLPSLIPDIPHTYDVYFAAFKDENMLEYYYPGGKRYPHHLEWMNEHWGTDPNEYQLKCVEPATGLIVGMATFDVYWDNTGTEAGKRWSRRDEEASWLEGFEKQRLELVTMALSKMREKLVGNRRHVYCRTMAVEPKYQRKGVGTLLLNWGIDVAERLGVPIYLEATIPGRNFYKRFGFQIPEFVIHKAATVRRDRDDIVPCMVKMPKKYEDLSVAEWQMLIDSESKRDLEDRVSAIVDQVLKG
ncbi:Acyl-CoA N-acyltransferase [Apiospora rasikravindrae]|uniref:Acyl-CoA N-acyltransferase n=1 Tax=Apiospora rasikravindrae TaxID=990691 RepID=A0ABR1SWW3_9PEZI